MDYKFFLSKLAFMRGPSVLKELFDSVGIDPDYSLMAAGVPNPDLFAIKSATIKLIDGSEVPMNEKDTRAAMQYGATQGFRELVEFVTNLTKRLHDPPTMDNPSHPGELSVTITHGSQDGIYKALECLIDEGNVILTAEPMNDGFLACLIPYGAIIEPGKTDKHGIIPESLSAILSKYQKQTGNDVSVKRKIKLLYCIPNGDNPTGIRYTVERKREIYRLAQEYNFLIMEDNAYYFLEERNAHCTISFSSYPLTRCLSMDVDGRVIRLESFSATVGPGFQLGYLLGPAPMVKKIINTAQVCSQGCSSMSQQILIHLLRKWGIDGYLNHSDRIRELYDKRRQSCIKLTEKYFQGISEWSAPTGGIFLWVRFPGIPDSKELIVKRLVKRKVWIADGSSFFHKPGSPSSYARISYSTVSTEMLEQGFKIIAEEARALQQE